MVKNWRANRTLPMRVKCLAWTMMALGSLWALWLLPLAVVLVAGAGLLGGRRLDVEAADAAGTLICAAHAAPDCTGPGLKRRPGAAAPI